MRRAYGPLGLLGLVLGLALVTRRVASAPNEMPHGDDFSIECEECHNPAHWTPVVKTRFQHATTGFVLEGAHATAGCRSCHQSLVFNRLGASCADCHQDVHRGELGPRCEDCHTPRGWSNQREMLSVHNRTRFPLLAVHATLDCLACHKGQRQPEYALTPVECEGCHRQTWERTTNPSHAAVGFSTRCEECHGRAPRGWVPVSSFTHSAAFPLRGGHAGRECAACHSAGYTGLSRECVACHEQDYLRTTNPNHAAGRFPRRCESCHTLDGWRPASFNHNNTRFPLTGAHAGVDCERCHPGGRYTGTSAECVACHRANYDATQNPNHAAAGFPSRCETCHSTQAWRPASFNHDTTRFPLTGAHTSVSCERCHPGGRYTGTSTDCYACHRANYDGTTSPSHAASGFPVQCQQCHTTSSWSGASFDHDGRYFPIYSGVHRGRWSSCADCHVNPSNYRVFECINCHAHNRTDMDDKHRGRSGYQYASSACYNCHPQGRAED